LQVLDGDTDVPLGSPKERAVLAVLLLHRGAVVSRERLIEGLWGESPPPTAEKALNVHVSQLRKTLALNGQEAIVTRTPGYALDVEPERLDAARFERLATEARARLASGDAASASRVFSEALSLWRGPAVDGVELESSARNEAGRLDELRLTAEMDRIDCDLALGFHEQVIGELERLVAEHPLRERLRGQLMLALYRSGRQADALRCYRETRHTLVGELGIEPSPALQRLEQAILNQDRSLEAPAGIAFQQSVAKRVPRSRTPPRRRWLVLTAVLVVGGIVAGVLLSRLSTKSLLVPPNSVGVIDPQNDRVVSTIPVGRRPGPVGYADGTTWVANIKDVTLTRIDSRTRHVVDVRPLRGSYPSALTTSAGVVWSGDPIQAAVTRVAGPNLRTFPIEQPPLGKVEGGPGARPERNAPCPTHLGLAIGGGSVWATCGPGFGRAVLTAIDPLTGKQHTTEYTAANDPAAITYADGALWVANFDANSVTELDPLDRTVKRTATVAAAPIAIAAYAGSVWVVGSGQNAVSRITIAADTGSPVVTTVRVGDRPDAIAAGDGAVWVANGGTRTISRIDPKTNRVTATIRVGGVPSGLAFGDGMLWVSSQAA
jgi:YVTN family beta-propeller protein